MRYDDDISDVLARRRAKSANKTLTLIVIAGGGLSVLVVGVLVTALLKSRQQAGNNPPTPDPTRVADTGGSIPFVPIPGGTRPTVPVASAVAGRMDVDRMTYRELYETLVAKGLGVRFASSGGRTYFVRGGNPKYDFDINSYVKLGTWPAGVVAVDQMPDEEAARQAAGRSLRKTYHFRRWYFTGDESVLAEIRKALED